MHLKECLLIADRGYIDEELEQTLTKAGIQLLIRGKVNTNGTSTKWFAEDAALLKQYIGQKFKDVPSNFNCDVTIRTAKGNILRISHRCNPMAKTKDRLSILRTNICRSKLDSRQIF